MSTAETPRPEDDPEQVLPLLDAETLALLADLAAQPHDALIKRVLTANLAGVGELFRSRMSGSLAASIDWTTLAMEPASFVKRDLKQTYSDLLFSVRRGNKTILIYLLFEHQSTIDPSMPLRLLGYMVEIWRRYRESHPTGLVPPVIPLVLNQGPSEWTVSTQFEDQFRDPKEAEKLGTDQDLTDLLPYLPKFTHDVFDLPKTEPRTELQDERLRISLYLMQQVRLSQSLQEFFRWLNANHGATIDVDFFRLLLLYALHADTALDYEKLLRETLTHQNLRTTIMTVAAQLKAEGESQGEARGRLLGSIATLESLLHLPATPTEILSSLSLAELEATLQKLRVQVQNRFPDAK